MSNKPNSSNVRMGSLLLRVGLGFVFLYAAGSALRQPDVWVAYIPNFTSQLIAAKAALDILAVFQIVLAIALFSGKYLKYAAIISTGLLIGIVIFNLNSLLVTFRDIGLIFMALALYALESN